MAKGNIVADLSLPQQKYIETIYELCVEHGHAHSKYIAERLNIKMPLVTEALRTLSALGVIHYEVRKAITLTDRGIEIAEELDSRHSNLVTLLGGVLGCSNERADTFACEVEHVIDTDLNNRIAEFVKFISNDCGCGVKMVDQFKAHYDEILSEESDGLS